MGFHLNVSAQKFDTIDPWLILEKIFLVLLKLFSSLKQKQKSDKMQIKTACNMHGNERLSKVIWKSFPLENYDSYHKVDLFSLVYKKQKVPS